MHPGLCELDLLIYSWTSCRMLERLHRPLGGQEVPPHLFSSLDYGLDYIKKKGLNKDRKQSKENCRHGYGQTYFLLLPS